MRKIFKKEKMLAFLLSTTMLFNMSGMAMAAETDVGKVKAVQAQTKEQNKVIEISSEAQLRKMADNLSGDYVLTKSITLKKKWQPIGDKKNPFTGTLDGKGHVIRGMDICLLDSKESGYAGLFGVMDSACVKNLALEDINITSAAKNGAYIGGIAGKMDNSSVSDVYVSGNITGQNVQNETIGGVAGAIFRNKVTSGENICLERTISRININSAKKGDTGLLSGWVSGLEYVQHCYTDSKRLPMFGTGVKWGQNRVLLKQSFLSENNFYGFDFKDTWETTKQGPKLCRQVEDDTLAFYKEKFSYATEERTKKKVIQEKEKQGTTDKQNTEINQKKETTQKSDTNILDTIKKQISNYSTALIRATSDITSGDFTYQLSGNDAQITSYKGSGGNVTIPETIDGHTVTKIKYNAFKNNANITGITLPKTITEVGSSAFENCTGLKSFRMNYNDTVEYTAKIGDKVFYQCTNLTNVEMSENVTSIGSRTFSGCTALKSLILPESVTFLGTQLIENTAISSITIPKNVKSCGSSNSNGTLANVKTLTTVIFEEGLEEIPANILASASYTSYVDNVRLPSEVKKIGGAAFYKCGRITEIELPKTITRIESSAFSKCTELKSFKMNYNDTVKYTVDIGAYVFSNCISLTNVELSENVTGIGAEAFSGCTSLKSLRLPESVTNLGYKLIQNTAISSIVIPKNVRSCGSSYANGTLANVKTLKTVIFEEGMEEIPPYVMASGSYTSYVDKVILPSQIKKIGGDAFYKCSNITEIELPKTITEIGGSAFFGCTELKSFRMNYNDTVEYTVKIGGSAFQGCTSLAEVVLSENVVSIGERTFSGDTALKSLTLPESVESLGYLLIENTAISSIVIPKNVTKCSSENSYRYNGPLANVKTLKSVTFEQGMKGIPSYIMASESYNSYVEKVIIPDTISSIGSHAFYKCEKITQMEVPKTITEIGSSAFRNCTGLKSFRMNYNDTVEYTAKIGGSAFQGCTSLAEVVLSENVVSIGERAFSGDTALKSLTLPESVESLGYLLIENTAISSMVIPKNVTKCSSEYSYRHNGPLANVKTLKSVTFEQGMKGIPSYIMASESYNSYVEKVIIPDTVTSIGSHAFYKCEKITQMEVPKTITEIGSSAFRNCTGLKSFRMNYNDTVEYIAKIGGSAFQGCTSLAEVVLSENVVSIGERAFSGDTALKSLTLPESVESLGYLLIENTAISSMVIPKNVTKCSSEYSYRHNGPLANVKTLKSVIFEQGMKGIPSYIMASESYNSYIEKVIIPDTVTSIGSHAFYKCDNITIYGYKNSYAETYANENDIPFVSVAIAKNATVQDVLSKIDLKKLLSKTSLGSTTINGPEVTVAGKTFPVFSFNAGGDLNLGEHLQAKVDMKTKTVQILIGLDDFKGSADLDADINSNNYWKESYAQVKSLYKGVRGANASTDKLYHGFQKLRGKLRKTQCKIGVNAEAEAVGYVEFSFASGEMMYKSGGLVMKASIGYEETQHFPPCPALYVVFGLNAQFGSELKLERIKEMQYAPSIDANINLAATVGVGAGVKKASTYAEVGVTGNLDIGIHLPESSLEKALNVGADVEVYFNSKAFGFDGPSYGPKKLGSVQIYPRNRRSRMKLHSAAIDSYDWSDATPMQRNYLKKSNTRLRSRAVTKIQKDSQFNKSNVYPYNAAQIVSLKNGKEFLFWIDDDGTKENVNKTSLMYSIKEEDSWSEPQKLAETGGANDYPYVYSDGNKIAVVWQKADKMNSDATLPQILKTVELYEIVYENGQFGTAKRITSANTTYEMMQKVAVNGNETAVVWVENSTNDPFQSSGKNTVKLSVKKGVSWTQKTIASNVDTVKNIALAYVSGEPVIVYETGDENTTTIHYEKGSTKKTYTGQGAQIENGILYYSDGQTIKSYDILTGYEESTGLPAMNDFTVVDNGRTKAVYTTIADGYKSELAVYSFDTSVGKWNEQAMVTDCQKYIRNYSVALDAQNNPVIALNAVTVNENTDDIYGDSTLMVLKQNQNMDIALTDNISYEESLVKPEGKLPIHFAVKNNGTQPVTSFTAKLSDEDGNVLTSQKIACYIDAGSTEMAQVIYNLPENITRHKVNLEIEAEGEDKLSDNSKEISVGYADLSLESVYLSGKRTEAYLEGTVENAGYDTAKNVKVNFYFEEEETPFKTVNVQTLSAGSQNSFKAAIPEKYMEVAPLAGGNNIHIEVASDTDELQYENNEKDFLILSPEEQRIALNAASLQLKEQESATLKVTYCDEGISEEDIIWGTSDDKVVTVDKNGKVTALQAGKAMITANMNGVQTECEVTVRNSQEETVQAVLLNVNSMRIKSGERQVLNTSILPESVKNSQFTWKSADESIATVSSLGRVTGMSAGETTITVTAADGYHFAECHVTVYQEVKQIYKVSFEGGQGATGENPSVITGTTGDTITLPENPYSKSGMVFEGWNDGSTTYKEGSSYKIGYSDVVFTAQWRNEEKAEYTITASAGQNGTITPSGNVKVKEGESQSFSITPAQDYTIEKVLVDGENIGAKTSYTFENVTKEHTILATFKKQENNIDIPIVPDIPRINKVKKIYLNGLSTQIAAGKKLKLTATILPANATNKKLLWKSSNQKAATVTKSGVVTLPKKGAGKKATITAMALDGSGVYAIWKVTSMSGIVKSIKLTGAKQVKAGKKVKVKAQIKATKKANKKLNWTSSNIKYATVTQNGAVKTKKAGKGKKIKITATATDGSGKKATITIKMK